MIELMQTTFRVIVINIKLIKTEEGYKHALVRLDQIFDAPKGVKESDEADVLTLLIDDYETLHYPIDAPDPIEAIKIRMEEMQLKQVDIAPALGGKNRASEILNRKRRLTVDMIRNLTKRLNLSASLLIKDYPISR